jgi:hypothetical protein
MLQSSATQRPTYRRSARVWGNRYEFFIHSLGALYLFFDRIETGDPIMIGRLILVLLTTISVGFLLYFELMMLRELKKAAGKRVVRKRPAFSRGRILAFRPPKPIAHQTRRVG